MIHLAVRKAKSTHDTYVLQDKGVFEWQIDIPSSTHACRINKQVMRRYAELLMLPYPFLFSACLNVNEHLVHVSLSLCIVCLPCRQLGVSLA